MDWQTDALRLIDRDLEGVSRGLEQTQLGGYIIPPMGPFAFLHGPSGEAIETFDAAFAAPQTG